MSTKQSRFPLSLSAVLDQKDPAQRKNTTAMPQTAVQNAAGHTLDRHNPSLLLNGMAVELKGAKRSSHGANVVHGQHPSIRVKSPLRPSSSSSEAMVSDKIRQAMVKRVAQQGVKDTLVLAALEAVPRHQFVESGLASQAYIDASLPIGHHQTISQPYIVARMIEILRNCRDLENVLEIGTGCGYQAAVLSLVAKEVYSIERIKALHELAKNNLRPLRIANLRLHYGDGMLGLPQVGGFDGIILAAAGLEVPQALLEQLSVGGRLVAPVGARNQVLQLIERISLHEWKSDILEKCHFVPLHQGVI